MPPPLVHPAFRQVVTLTPRDGVPLRVVLPGEMNCLDAIAAAFSAYGYSPKNYPKSVVVTIRPLMKPE